MLKGELINEIMEINKILIGIVYRHNTYYTKVLLNKKTKPELQDILLKLTKQLSRYQNKQKKGNKQSFRLSGQYEHLTNNKTQ